MSLPSLAWLNPTTWPRPTLDWRKPSSKTPLLRLTLSKTVQLVPDLVMDPTLPELEQELEQVMDPMLPELELEQVMDPTLPELELEPEPEQVMDPTLPEPGPEPPLVMDQLLELVPQLLMEQLLAMDQLLAIKLKLTAVGVRRK